MKDTSREIQNKYFEMLMNKSGEERIIMASKMEESAREMVLASLTDNISEKEKKIELFLRYYKEDFSNEELARIKNHLKAAPG
ncbi:MAG: hypothetical protein U9R41_00015 [Candidatus Marinimicrobia bacterium]|nr:hypothetical protein [Candidatus Neomarinimicrobiota bacterium]